MSQILQDFSAYLKSSERSSLTVKNYLADLLHFERWFLETNVCANFNPSDVTSTDLREFKQFLLINKEMKPASINRRLASLRSLLKWANEVGISPDFQLSKIPKFEKTEKTGIRWLDRKEENALLRSVEGSGAKRDIAIIKLLLNTGLRVAELCSLRWSEIIINERKGILTVLQGKGGKRREVPLNYDARQVLLDLGYKQNAGKKDWIFVGQRGRLTPRGVQSLFRKYADSMKLNNLSPHSGVLGTKPHFFTLSHSLFRKIRSFSHNSGDFRSNFFVFGISLHTIHAYNVLCMQRFYFFRRI